MCGIFITNDPEVTLEHEQIIEKTLRFRGPDCASGLVEQNNWKAYHSRLSIIDVDTGSNQPVIDDDGGMLVFNGEILNYKELGLKYFNEIFVSDTLLLSKLIINKCLNLDELDGFFAFAYVDSNGMLKYLARDKFGVKPLYYYKNNDYISISSEPSTLKSLYQLSVNDIAVEEYKSIRSPIFSQSFFSGIEQVNPGECLVNGKYFVLENYFYENSDEVCRENIIDAIKNGINTRKISDTPVGLLLSKGIDSNLIKSLSNFDFYYSIGFSGDEDLEYLKKQNIKGLKLVEYTYQEYLKDFNFLIELRQEPMSVPNEVSLYRVAKLASEDGVKVLLSGEGADEFFAGYDRIFQWALKTNDFNLDEFLDLYCYIKPECNSKTYENFEKLFLTIEHLNLKPFDKVRWFFIKYHMPILFRRLDFSLMAAGVEGREPIANNHVFECAIKMSGAVLMGDTLGKIPLREIVKEYLGFEFAYEKKVGFPVDLTKIFDNPKGISSYELWFEKNLEILK